MNVWNVIKEFLGFKEVEKIVVKPYVPKYKLRTEAEHAQIRESLQINPKFCNHLKGHIRSPRLGLGVDYNVSFHTFINGVSRVRCNKCGKKWFQTDPDWEYALSLVRSSTNHKSSSEQILYYVCLTNGEERYYRTTEEIKNAFPQWDGVVSKGH